MKNETDDAKDIIAFVGTMTKTNLGTAKVLLAGKLDPTHTAHVDCLFVAKIIAPEVCPCTLNEKIPTTTCSRKS